MVTIITVIYNVFGNRLAKIAEVKSKLTFANLKSTGQSKYALDEKEEGVSRRYLSYFM